MEEQENQNNFNEVNSQIPKKKTRKYDPGKRAERYQKNKKKIAEKYQKQKSIVAKKNFENKSNIAKKYQEKRLEISEKRILRYDPQKRAKRYQKDKAKNAEKKLESSKKLQHKEDVNHTSVAFDAFFWNIYDKIVKNYKKDLYDQIHNETSDELALDFESDNLEKPTNSEIEDLATIKFEYELDFKMPTIDGAAGKAFDKAKQFYNHSLEQEYTISSHIALKKYLKLDITWRGCEEQMTLSWKQPNKSFEEFLEEEVSDSIEKSPTCKKLSEFSKVIMLIEVKKEIIKYVSKLESKALYQSCQYKSKVEDLLTSLSCKDHVSKDLKAIVDSIDALSKHEKMQLDISKCKSFANGLLDSSTVFKDINDMFEDTLKDIKLETCEMEKKLKSLVPKECQGRCYWKRQVQAYFASYKTEKK